MKFLQKLQTTFGPKPAQQAIVKPSTTGEMPNSEGTGGGKTPTAAPSPVSENPLDFYFQSRNNSSTTAKPGAPEFNIPTETIQGAASKLDFTGGISQEAMAKLQAGDFSVMPEILNAVGRNAYQTGIEHNVAITNKYVSDRLQYEQGVVDDRIGSRMVQGGLRSTAGLSPAAQKMFGDTVETLRQQYPGASIEDLEGAAMEIHQDMAQQFNFSGKAQEQAVAAQEVDYDQMGGYGPGEGEAAQ